MAHPRKESFCHALCNSYVQGAKDAGNEVRTIELRDLSSLENFLRCEYKEKIELPEDLKNIQSLISWADYLVFVYPIWWATPPALLKVFFESVFQSGFAFSYKKSKGIIPRWDKLLKGKTAQLFTTMDSPSWYYWWFVGDPSYKMMKGTLGFCGIQPIYKNYFGSVLSASSKKKELWLQKVYLIGLNK